MGYQLEILRVFIYPNSHQVWLDIESFYSKEPHINQDSYVAMLAFPTNKQ